MKLPLYLAPALLVMMTVAAFGQPSEHQVEPIDAEFAEQYDLDRSFYKKHTSIEGIEIVSSNNVPDHAHREAAFLIDKMMGDLRPDIAERIRKAGVLYLLLGSDELPSDVPELNPDVTGDELDYYNWRHRGMKMNWDGRPVVMSAEEDLLKYEGGMQDESIFIHEFAHLVHGTGFDKKLKKRLQRVYRVSMDRHLWHDARPAQRFRRVESDEPVSLLDALDGHFDDYSREFFRKCFADGRILVNGKPAEASVKVTGEDKVLMLYDGPKEAYAAKNRAEYWAEIAQAWYDTNRTHDHDHNHVDRREELIPYNPIGAALCAEVWGEDAWRFVPPQKRHSQPHLKGYDPATAPVYDQPESLDEAANDYYDDYWKPFRDRLKKRYMGGDESNGDDKE
jgi:hypothetical protein